MARPGLSQSVTANSGRGFGRLALRKPAPFRAGADVPKRKLPSWVNAEQEGPPSIMASSESMSQVAY